MILQIALGIVTAIGGFIDVGAIATTALAGAQFGFQLLWAVLLATLCVILLTEMCGRLAAVSDSRTCRRAGCASATDRPWMSKACPMA